MSVVIGDDVRAAITAGRLAHLVTLNPDGSPQVSLVWVGMDGDRIVSAHLGAWRKVENIRHNPRVVLSIEAEGQDERGLDRYLVVHGTAEILEGGAPELLQRLSQIYIGPGTVFPPMENPPPGYVNSITIDRIGGVGPWAE